MQFYMAPLEGITGYIFRTTYHKYFHNIDKYFTPFVTPSKKRGLKKREIQDILPENNNGIVLVPQVLTNNAEDFLLFTKTIQIYGYDTVNINLGCPSGTVVSKHKGSGFLAIPDKLDKFLNEIFEKSTLKISIKTRIGVSNPDEFYKLIEIYNKYSIEELIIHPRVQKDFYNNKPNLLIYDEAQKTSKNRICYNGDIFSVKDYNEFLEKFPNTDRIMIGRGILKNPKLIDEIKNETILDMRVIKSFHDELCERYQELYDGDKDVLYKMKEIWFYLSSQWNDDKLYKKIRKAQDLETYKQIINKAFQQYNF